MAKHYPSCQVIVCRGPSNNSQPVTDKGVTTSQKPPICGNDRYGSAGRTQRKLVYRKRLRQCGNFCAGAGYVQKCQKGTFTAAKHSVFILGVLGKAGEQRSPACFAEN